MQVHDREDMRRAAFTSLTVTVLAATWMRLDGGIGHAAGDEREHHRHRAAR